MQKIIKICEERNIMDHIDSKILHCLTEDARMNASQISQRVNLSVSAVIERMKKMEASGLIRGYTVVIDQERAGLAVQALLSIRLEHPKYNEEFNRQMCDHPHVIECFYITGDFDYIARIGVASTQELTEVLNDIKQIPGVSLTRTYVVLDNVKQNLSVVPY